MNNKPVALTQADILGILQDAYSVPLGQPIFNSSEEYNKLKAIIESAIRYTHPVKELTDEKEALKSLYDAVIRYENLSPFADTYAVESCEFQLHDAKEKARAILRKAQEHVPLYTHPVKEQDTDCQYCKQGCIRCDARKQLTDEEITQVFDECYPNNADGDVVTLVDFARAILRKAQEK